MPSQVSARSAFRPLHYIAYILLCGIWGSTWLAIRVLVRDVPPLRGAGMRFVLAAALLALGAAARRTRFPQSRREWRAVAILSVTMMAVPYGLLFWGEQYVTSSMTAVLYSLSPLTVALLTPFTTQHRVPERAIVCMLVGVAGVGLLFAHSLAGSRSTLLGGLAVLGAMVISAWSAIFAKKEAATLDPMLSTCLQLVLGAVLLLPASFLAEAGRPSMWTRSAVLAVLFLAVAGSAVAFAVYYWLLKHMFPYQLSTISLIVPIIAMLEGGLALHEPISLPMIGAAALVLVAVAAVLRAEGSGEVILREQQTTSDT